MAAPKLLLSKLLHHSRQIQTISSFTTSTSCSLFNSYFFFTDPSPHPSPRLPSIPTNISFSCAFSTHGSEHEILNVDTDAVATQSELSGLGFGGSEIGDSLGNISGEDSILPVRALISLLDGYHDLTGFPWWIIIGSSTLALRMILFPLLILQLTKLKRIAELFPKLPPPLPLPLSERSYKDQFMLFTSKKTNS